MFSRKNIIVIALIAIFVIGAVALNAAYYDIHVTCNHSGYGSIWLEDSNGNRYDERPVTWTNGTEDFTLIAPDGIGVDVHAYGTSTWTSDHDWASAQPYWHTYLFLDLAQPDPNKTPSYY